MYLNQLSDKELLNHLDNVSSDPLILRLVNMVRTMHEGLIEDLVDAGMDLQTMSFQDGRDGDHYYAAHYIRHLIEERDHWREEHYVQQEDAQDLREKLKQRETLTVSKLIEELRNNALSAQSMQRMAQRDLEKAYEAREEMRKKLDMWDTMRTP
jgi:uncharacterized protein with von Willebrand factor type A (vWA) domain